LELVNYHEHAIGFDIEVYPTCKSSEFRVEGRSCNLVKAESVKKH
jgi:hypothetical protein